MATETPAWLYPAELLQASAEKYTFYACKHASGHICTHAKIKAEMQHDVNLFIRTWYTRKWIKSKALLRSKWQKILLNTHIFGFIKLIVYKILFQSQSTVLIILRVNSMKTAGKLFTLNCKKLYSAQRNWSCLFYNNQFVITVMHLDILFRLCSSLKSEQPMQLWSVNSANITDLASE